MGKTTEFPEHVKRLISSFTAFCSMLGGESEASPFGAGVALSCSLAREADTVVVRRHGSELSISLVLGSHGLVGALAPVDGDEVRVEVRMPRGEVLSVQKGAGAGSYVRFKPSGKVSVRRIALDYLPGSWAKLTIEAG